MKPSEFSISTNKESPALGNTGLFYINLKIMSREYLHSPGLPNLNWKHQLVQLIHHRYTRGHRNLDSPLVQALAVGVRIKKARLSGDTGLCCTIYIFYLMLNDFHTRTLSRLVTVARYGLQEIDPTSLTAHVPFQGLL